jgi:hypothetical protein
VITTEHIITIAAAFLPGGIIGCGMIFYNKRVLSDLDTANKELEVKLTKIESEAADRSKINLDKIVALEKKDIKLCAMIENFQNIALAKMERIEDKFSNFERDYRNKKDHSLKAYNEHIGVLDGIVANLSVLNAKVSKMNQGAK